MPEPLPTAAEGRHSPPLRALLSFGTKGGCFPAFSSILVVLKLEAF